MTAVLTPERTVLVATVISVACSGEGVPGAAASGRPLPAIVARIQGAGHVSPLRGRRVVTTGVVTAAAAGRFFLQDPAGDGELATSEGVVVVAEESVSTGDSVRVSGTVREHVPGGPATANLSVTRIEASAVETLAAGARLPAPVVLGRDGRLPPQVDVIGSDELPVDLVDPVDAAANPFDPETEGIDFFESLEGMRVELRRAVAIAPTRRYSGSGVELWVLVEEGAHVTPRDARTARGGLRLPPHPHNRGDHNPERVRVRFDPAISPHDLPVLATGDRPGDLVGVVGYGFGNFEVIVTDTARAEPASLEPGATRLGRTEGRVTLATYNVRNLDPLPETAGRLARLGEQIAARLRGPDVVALQEIMDGNGTRGGAGDPATDATPTLRALARAVEAAAGPRYVHVDRAPEPNTTGGAPGGNIRVAYLWNPARVDTLRTRSLTPEVLRGAGVRDPEAFVGGRHPLLAVFSFRGRPLTVINVHFASRRGSTPVFGAVQPFVQAGESAREAQSRAVHDYVAALLADDPAAAVVVAGDMNTYEFTDDLTEMLVGSGEGDAILENLLLRVPPAVRYTYIFDGNAGAVDHVLVTGSLRETAEVDVVHLNVDLPDDRAASDHDPVVARLAIPGGG